MATELPTKLKPFVFHGIAVANRDSENANCHCFSCGKDKHMNISIETGKWRCLVCEARGNIFSFLQQLYDLCLATTTPKQLSDFAAERKLTVAGLKAWGVCYNHLNDTWLIPGFSAENKLVNLYKCQQNDEGKWLVLNTPGCKITTMNSQNTSQKKVYVCEGPWDGIALWSVLSSIGYNQEKGSYYKAKTTDASLLLEEGVCSVPGAGSVPKDFPVFIKGRDAVILFDNDHPRTTPAGNVIKPGWDGTMALCKLLSKGKNKPSTLHHMKWGEEGFCPKLPNGFDIKDLVNESQPHIAYRKIQLGLVAASALKSSSPENEEDDEEEVIEPIHRSSFSELCEDWKSKLFFPESLRRAVAVAIATLFSTTLEGEQVWIRVIGQPGTGKTTLAEAIAAAKLYAKSLSMFTGFHSGHSGTDGSETSLIPSLNGKMLIIKDGDTLLTASSRDRILAELRDIYDGVSRAQYRTGKKSIHSNLRISIMLCGTDTLRLLNRSSLGERFIDVEIIDNSKATHDKYVKSSISRSVTMVSDSISGGNERPKSNPFVKQCTLGYINHLKSLLADRAIVVPTMTKEDEYTIECMANYVAYMRARADKDDEGLCYKPRAELGTRLGAQFVKLAICLAITMNKKKVDTEVLDIIYGISRHTTQNYRSDIVDILTNVNEPVTKQQVAITLNIPETSVDRLLNEMLTFGIIRICKLNGNNSGNRGRRPNGWQLSNDFQTIHDHIRVTLAELPTSVLSSAKADPAPIVKSSPVIRRTPPKPIAKPMVRRPVPRPK